MKQLKLSTKILVVSIVVLLLFSFASFGILFRALSNQTSHQMDQLLKNESLALSTLVDIDENYQIDFEMPANFMTNFKQRNPNGFFSFNDPNTKKILKTSFGAPKISCEDNRTSFEMILNNQTYRIETLVFEPEVDHEANPLLSKNKKSICLVVGLNTEPYWDLLVETLLSSIPVLILIVILLIIALLVMIRGLTKDLIALTSSLSTADFSGTHSFPVLPHAKTQEVRAIVDVLEELHRQASEVYREMWLFMGRAAHQIKTPVTAMQATLEVLLRRERSKDELLNGLEDVQSAAKLLTGLTKKLISHSRLSYEQTASVELIDLKIFFQELGEIFKSKAEINGIKIIIASNSSLHAFGNREIMTDIFGNLIENAVLYSPQQVGAKISITWRSDEHWAVIDILDQGIGFPSSVRTDLFKPFIRGDERRVVGSGLGLSIAKKSVELISGKIELVESTQDGSKMRVWLPLTAIQKASSV